MCERTLTDAFIGIIVCFKLIPFIHYAFANCMVEDSSNAVDDMERGELLSERQIKNIFADDISLLRFFSMHSHLSIIFASTFLNLLLNNNICIGSYDYLALKIFCFVILPLDVVIIGIELGSSNELNYLNNLGREQSLLEYLKVLIRTKPSISMQVECYHYETETYTTTVNI